MRTIGIAASACGLALMVYVACLEIIPAQETVNAAMAYAGLMVAFALAYGVQGYCRKVGGLTFLRLGRLSLSFCITKE